MNINLGVKYFECSIQGGNIDSALYLSRMLFEGKKYTKRLCKGKKYLSSYLKKDVRASTFYGIILLKEGNVKEAKKFFKEGVEKKNPECMFEYAKKKKKILKTRNFISYYMFLK